jgi:hypothetical protein
MLVLFAGRVLVGQNYHWHFPNAQCQEKTGAPAPRTVVLETYAHFAQKNKERERLFPSHKNPCYTGFFSNYPIWLTNRPIIISVFSGREPIVAGADLLIFAAVQNLSCQLNSPSMILNLNHL